MMRSQALRRSALLLSGALLACGFSARPTASQEVQLADRVEPGDRIRLVAPPLFPQPEIGVFTSHDETLLYVDLLVTGADSVAIPLRNLSSLEVSTGRDHKTWTGLAIGAGVGLLAGALLTSAFCSDPDSSCDTHEAAPAVLIVAVPFAALGGIVGSMVQTERWVEVPFQ